MSVDFEAKFSASPSRRCFTGLMVKINSIWGRWVLINAHIFWMAFLISAWVDRDF